MQKYEYYTQFSYINEKQLQIYCCALALGMEDFSPKNTDMFDFTTLSNSKQLMQRNLTFLNSPDVRTLATSLLKGIEDLLEFKPEPHHEPIVDFTDFYLLENYLSKFRYFYLTYRCQEILDDNRYINFMDDGSSDINFTALLTLNFFSEF